MCVAVCPVLAFEVEVETREVVFSEGKCIVCDMCVKVCPYKAMKEEF